MKFMIESEGNNIWMLLLEKKMYKEAFELVERHKPEFRDQLASKLADHYIESKNFDGAVALWSRTDYPFEMAAMTLLDHMSTELKARTAFIKLLENYVRQMKPEREVEKNVLLAWALENIVYRYSEAERTQEIAASYPSIATELNFNPETV